MNPPAPELARLVFLGSGGEGSLQFVPSGPVVVFSCH